MFLEMHNEAVQQINVLIADDDKAIADILKDLIADEGRIVDVYHNGLDAVDGIQKKSYDLMLVDMVMPGVGGLEVLKCAKKTNPEVVVIIITGYATLETAITAIKEGAYDYIRKPCKLEEIKIAVENAIDKILVNRENRALLKKLQDAYQELMVLNQEKGEGVEKATFNFFPSHMPSLKYLYNHTSPSDDYVEKLQVLSALKEKGALTEKEFKEFKCHLIEKISLKG
jgi:YesN/AraC family two-component response regulator